MYVNDWQCLSRRSLGSIPNAKRPEKKTGKEAGTLSTSSYKVSKGRPGKIWKFMQNFKDLKLVSGLEFIKSTLP